MSGSDKKKLYDKITKLDENDIEYVIRILTKGKCDDNKSEEFEIDLDKTDSKILREVQNFIDLRDNDFLKSKSDVSNPIATAFVQAAYEELNKIDKKTKK